MEKLFTTESLHVRDRFDYWHSVTCKELVEHDGEPACRLSFTAEIYVAALADIGIFRFEHSPIHFSHAHQHIAVAKSDDLFLFRQLQGNLTFEQAEKDLELAPGDMALVDPMLPYRGRFPDNAKMLVLKVPRRELEARLGPLHEVIARLIHPKPGVSGLTSSFVSMLPGQVGGMVLPEEEAIRTQTLDLVALALCDDLELMRPKSSPRSLALARIRSVINSRLTEPTLTAEIVAAAAGVSTRYANLVLAEQGTSLSRMILAARLRRCRKALADPQQAHRTLSEIAYGWGFSDMTHFGRAFKKAFGLLPSKYRFEQF